MVSLSCCITPILAKIYLSDRWLHILLYFSKQRSSWSTRGPVAAKQAQIISVSQLVLGVWFSLNVKLWLKHLHISLICPKDIVPEVLRFVQMNLCKPKLSCHVPLRENRLSPGNPSNQAIIFQSFSNCTVISLNI